MMSRRVRWSLAAVVSLIVLLAAAALLRPSEGDRLLPTLDSLPVPATWETVDTTVIDGDFLIKARATRSYFVDADPIDAVPAAKQIAEAAGFIVRPRVLSLDGCKDSFPPAAMDGPCGPVVADECPSTNGGLPNQCIVEALRWHDEGERIQRLWVVLDHRGNGLTIGNGEDRHYVNDPIRALFTLTVDEVSRDHYPPLPSWPPA